MNGSVDELARELGGLVSAPDRNDHVAISDPSFLDALESCAERLRRLDADARRAVVEAVVFDRTGGDVVLKNSLLFRITGDLFFFRQIVHPVFARAPSLNLDFIHYIYWAIQRQLFLVTKSSSLISDFSANEMFRLYKMLVTECSRRLPARALPRPGSARAPIRKVLFVINQYLGPLHQPSREVFHYAAAIRAHHGLETGIVNANLMPLEAVAPFFPPMIANLDDRFSGRQRVEVDGEVVSMYSVRGHRFDTDKLERVLGAVAAADPDVVVSFGGSCVAADLLAGVRPSLCVPTGSWLIHSLADVVFAFNSDQPLDMPSCLFPSRVAQPFRRGFPLPKTWQTLVRTEIGIAGDATVFAVVGNRLDDEVTDDFLEMIDAILGRVPDGVVVIAGAVRTLADRVTGRGSATRVRCLGSVDDIRALYRITDLLLNPARAGGGASVAYALAEGVPVVTFAQGDGGAVAGAEFAVPDRQAYVARAVAIATTDALRRDLGARARTRFALVGDTRPAIDTLVAHARALAGG